MRSYYQRGETMRNTFTSRSQAATFLKGKWKTAILVQCLCIGAEILLIVTEGICLYCFPAIPIFPIGVLVDLLLLSPLKAGRALLYETVVSDGDKASTKLLFRFFSHGYTRSIGWRLELWLRRIGWHILFSVPSALFLFISRAAEQRGRETLAMIAFIFSLLFLVIAFLVTEILLFRYIPAVYLLSKVASSRHALLLSKRLSKGYTNNWTLLYLDYAGWSFSFLLLFPFFYVSPLFHTARAATVKRLFSEISPQIHQQLLQRGKNHGRIRNEF